MKLLKQISTTLLLLCLVTFTYAQGDNCATAVPITPGAYAANGPSTGAGASAQGDATNADWYSFTSSVTGLLSVSACGGGQDTRLSIWSGTCGALTAEAENDDFCIIGGGNNDAFASEVSNIPVLAGITYYIEWDDRWSAGAFNFTLDFIVAPPNDGAMVGDVIPFYQIPVAQLPAGGIELIGTVASLGFNNSSNVTVSVEVTDESGNSVLTETATTLNIVNAFEEEDVVAGTFTGPIGKYDVCFTVAIDETDAEASNDTYCRPLWITKSVYAIDETVDESEINGFGVGQAGVLVTQGQAFQVNAADEISAIDAYFGGGAVGDTVQYQIYEVNADSTVGMLVYNSLPNTLTAVGQGWTQHLLPTPFAVAPGRYMIAVAHNSRGANIGLGITSNSYIPNNAWVRINNDSWENIEIFNNGDFVYLIRPSFGPLLEKHAVTFNVNMNPIIEANALSDDGVHIAGTFQNWDPAATEMSDPDGDGIYSYTATDIEEGTAIEFKYINGNTFDTDESLITADCGVDNGQGSFNRTWVVGTADEETPAYCYNFCVTTCAVAIDEVTFESALQLYPNPTAANTTIYYNFPESIDLDVKVLNNIGQVVYSKVITNTISGNVELDVEQLVSGVYFVTMSDGENLVSKKLFLER